MAYFLVTFHESDGNDCTVYDCIIEADSEDSALERLSAHAEAIFKSNGTAYEQDGSEFGYYFLCDEDNPCVDYCDGHGGVSLRSVERFDVRELAEQACCSYHSQYFID